MNKSRIRLILGIIIIVVLAVVVKAYISNANTKKAEDNKSAAQSAVESFYKELKTGNYDVVKTATTTDDELLKDKPLMTDIKTGEPLTADEQRLVKALIKNATYVVTDVKPDTVVRTDKSPRMIVDGKLTVSNLNKLYYFDSIDSTKQKSKSGAFNSQAEIDTYMTNYLWSAVENGTAPTKNQNFSLTVIKQNDGSWKIQRDKGTAIVGALLTHDGGLEYAQWFNKSNP